MVSIFSKTALVIFTTFPVAAEEKMAMIDWPYVGSEQSQTKYSKADEITQANVNELEILWEWKPNEFPLEEFGTKPGPFQATPIMVDNILYLSTMYMRVVALNAETGEELWSFDPKVYEGGSKGVSPSGFKHRGIAYWREDNETRIVTTQVV